MTAKRPPRANQRGRSAGRRVSAVDVWRTAGPLPELEPIRRSRQPGALLRSLGDLPMHDSAAAEPHFTSVIEEAARVAAALALSAGLLDLSND